MCHLVPLQCGRVRVRCTSVLLRLRVTRSWKGKEASHSSDTLNRSFSFISRDHVLLFYLSAFDKLIETAGEVEIEVVARTAIDSDGC